MRLCWQKSKPGICLLLPNGLRMGSQVAIRGIDGELYLVSRDGVIREYRLPPDPSQSGVEQWFLRRLCLVFGMGKQLAVWTRAGEEPSSYWDYNRNGWETASCLVSNRWVKEPFPLRSLMLLDVNSGTLTDLCISTRWGARIGNYITSFFTRLVAGWEVPVCPGAGRWSA